MYLTSSTTNSRGGKIELSTSSIAVDGSLFVSATALLAPPFLDEKTRGRSISTNVAGAFTIASGSICSCLWFKCGCCVQMSMRSRHVVFKVICYIMLWWC